MARPSRPPGFDMTYKPKKATYGPPFLRRLPALIYFGVASIAGILVLIAPLFSRDSWLYQYIVEADYHRMMGSKVFAILLFSSALAAVLRQAISGVVVHADGIEIREVVALGLPKFSRYAWAQIDRVRIPSRVAVNKQRVDQVQNPDNPLADKIRLDLWDGSKAWLPAVQKHSELSVTIERVALARAIPIEGGSGVLDELGNPFEEEAEAAA
jgi:hypothetical protein